MVFLQKVKSARFELWNIMTYSWNGPFWALDHCQGSGRVLVVLSPSLQSFVLALGSDPKDACVWLRVLLQDQVIGLFEVYFLNGSSDKRKLWDWMASSLSSAK